MLMCHFIAFLSVVPGALGVSLDDQFRVESAECPASNFICRDTEVGFPFVARIHRSKT